MGGVRRANDDLRARINKRGKAMRGSQRRFSQRMNTDSPGLRSREKEASRSRFGLGSYSVFNRVHPLARLPS